MKNSSGFPITCSQVRAYISAGYSVTYTAGRLELSESQVKQMAAAQADFTRSVLDTRRDI